MNMGDVWQPVAQGLSFLGAAFVAITLILTVFMNFCTDERHHPLDFYSNKIRTRPYWLLIELVLLAGILVAVFLVKLPQQINDNLPEVAIAAYAQGLIIGVSELTGESASASFTSMVLYAFVCCAIVVMTLIPTLQFARPGAFYAGMYLVFNMIIVAWIRTGVKRHLGVDGGQKLLPAGAERLFQLWAVAVLRWNPLVLVLTSMAYVVVHLYDTENYGWACAIFYYILAGLLVFGCCKSFNDGTELE